MRKLDHDEERLKIAEVAANLIAEKGSQHVTVNHIAKAMDATRGKVLHYFGSSQEVITAAFEWASQQAVERLAELASGLETLELNEEIIANILPLDEQTDIEWKVRFACWEASLSSEEGVDTQKAIADSRIEVIVQIFDRLQQQGIVELPDAPEIMAQRIYDMVNGLGITLLYYPMEERRARCEGLFSFVREFTAAGSAAGANSAKTSGADEAATQQAPVSAFSVNKVL